MKMLFIIDSYTWALANRAENLKSRMPEHTIDVVHFKEINDIDFNDYNVIYSLNWPIHAFIENKIKVPKRKYRLYTTICSHEGRPKAKNMGNIFKYYDRISCSNSFIYKEFLTQFPKKAYYTPFGVDSTKFIRETNPNDFSDIFGFVGNDKRDVKRFDLIKKAIESVSGANLLTATPSNFLNRDQMVKFYNSIGTLICFSNSEGTPNPVLEAGATARGIISTNVGNVPQINKNDNIIIVNTYDNMCKEVADIVNKKYNLKKNGLITREIIKNEWDWNVQIVRFKRFLE
jgi:glycosyltransferase involved in cell wall biosynthesis